MSARGRTLTELMNLGPATAGQLAELGIADEAALRRIGPVAAYHRLKFANPRGTTLNALYALHGALTDTHWAALPVEVRDALRREAAGLKGSMEPTIGEQG